LEILDGLWLPKLSKMAYPGAGRPLKAQQQNQQFYPPPSSYENGYQNQMPPIPYQNGLSNHYQPPPGPPPPNNPIQQPTYNNVQWEAPPPNYFQQNPGKNMVNSRLSFTLQWQEKGIVNRNKLSS
jgi:hypothetical protein